MADPRNNFEIAIQTAIDSNLKELHTALPAVVTKFTASTQLIDCQPTIKRKLNGQLVNLPLLVDVPIRYMKSANFSINFPLNVDDHVLIICAERCIDNWLTTGEIRSPDDIRKHTLSDAFAIPMMFSQNELISNFDTSNLEIRTNDGSGHIKITPAGGIELNGNADSAVAYNDLKTAFDELVSDFNTLVSLFNSHTHSGVQSGGSSTGPPSGSGSSSSADMSSSELTTIKVP